MIFRKFIVVHQYTIQFQNIFIISKEFLLPVQSMPLPICVSFESKGNICMLNIHDCPVKTTVYSRFLNRMILLSNKIFLALKLCKFSFSGQGQCSLTLTTRGDFLTLPPYI